MGGAHTYRLCTADNLTTFMHSNSTGIRLVQELTELLARRTRTFLLDTPSVGSGSARARETSEGQARARKGRGSWSLRCCTGMGGPCCGPASAAVASSAARSRRAAQSDMSRGTLTRSRT